jgi:chromosome segregation ATPase
VSDASTATSRLIGAMFVENGFVTDEQLQSALEIQQRTGERLGEVLVAHFGVSRLELASMLADQWADIERGGTPAEQADTPVPVPPPPVQEEPGTSSGGEPGEPADPADADRRPIGEIFVEQGFVTAEELERALVTQRETGQRLGEALVAQGSITRLELASALADQWAGLQKLRPPQPQDGQNGAESPPVEPPAAPPAPVADGPDLASRVNELASTVQAIGDVEAARSSLAERIEELELRVHSISTLDGDLQALRDGIDELRNRPAADPDARHRLDELSARVDTLAVAPAGQADEELAARLVALERRIAAAAGSEDVREAFDAVREEMREVASQLGELPDTETVERRLDGLEARLSDGTEQHKIRSAVADLQAEVAALGGRDERNRLDELAQRLDALEGSLPSPAALDALRDDVARLNARPEPGSEQLEELAGRVRAIGDVDMLRMKIGELAERPTFDPVLAARVDEIASRLDELALQDPSPAPDETFAPRMQEVERRLDSAVAPQELHEALDALRRELHDVAARAADVASSAVDETLAPRLEDVERRLEAAAPAQELHDALDAVRRDLHEVAARAADAASRGANETVESRLQEVERRLEAASRTQELGEELEAVRRDLHEVAARPAGDPDLAPRVESLARRVDELASARAVQVDDTLGPRVDDLERRLAGAVGAEAVDERLERVRAEIRELAARLDGQPAPPDLRPEVAALQESIRTLAERSEAVGPELASLRGSVDELSAAASSQPTDSVEPRLEDLERRVESLAGADDVRGAFERVEAQLRDVATRLDDVPSRPDVMDEVDALRAWVTQLAERPTGDPGLAAKLESLAGRVEQVRAMGAEIRALRTAVDELAAAPAPVDEALVSKVGELEQRLASLASAGDVAAQLDGLRAEIHAATQGIEVPDVAPLEHRLDDVEARLADASELRRLEEGLRTLRAEHAETLDGLRQEQEATRAQLAEQGFAGHDDLTALGERLAALEQRAADGAVVASLRADLDALADGLVRADDLTALRDAVARLEQRHPADPAVPGRLDELQAAVAELAARPAVGPEVEGRLEELARRLEDLTSTAAPRHDLDGLAGAVAQLERRPVPDPDLPTRIADLADRIDSLEPTSQRLDELVSRVEELSARPPGDPAVAERVADLERRLAASTAQAQAVWERLDGDLASVRGATEQAAADAAESARRLEGALGARLDAHAAEARGATEAVHEQLGGRMEEVASRVDASDASVAGLRDELSELGSQLETREAALAESVKRAVASARAGQQRLERALADLASVTSQQHEELQAGGRVLDERLDALAERPAVDETARGDVAELRQTLAGLGATLEELVDARGMADAANAELVARIDDLAVRAAQDRAEGEQALRSELGSVAARLEESDAAGAVARDELRSELERAASSVGWRLERVEEALAADDRDALRETIAGLEQRLEGQDERQEEQVRVTERALRKGLASLGERLVESEAAYVEAGNALRRSIERLGSALVEADVAVTERGSTEILALHHANATAYVAFAPTSEGYRLVVVDGPAPGVGDRVTLPQAEGELLVARVGASPIPLDTRPCAYLERA